MGGCPTGILTSCSIRQTVEYLTCSSREGTFPRSSSIIRERTPTPSSWHVSRACGLGAQNCRGDTTCALWERQGRYTPRPRRCFPRPVCGWPPTSNLSTHAPSQKAFLVLSLLLLRSGVFIGRQTMYTMRLTLYCCDSTRYLLPKPKPKDYY